MQGKNYHVSEISSNLRRLIRLDGRSQKEIADAAGINPVNLSRWTKGQRIPTEESLLKIAEILGVTLADITERITMPTEPEADTRTMEAQLYEWRERALVAEAKLAHLRMACSSLGQHVSALGITVKNFSEIISE